MNRTRLAGYSWRPRRGAGAVERGGLENRWACKRPLGSNPSPAASARAETAASGGAIQPFGRGVRSRVGAAVARVAVEEQHRHALAEAGVNIGIISTSAIRISCVVPAADVETAVQAVHERFKLHDPVLMVESG